MMSKKIDLRKVRIRKRYLVSELAKTLGVTIQAIYWRIKYKNLPVLMINNVMYIYGREFKKSEFERRSSQKIQVKENEFKCFSCRKSVVPINNEVAIEDFKTSNKQVTNGVLQLVGKCTNCEKNIYRFSNVTQLEDIKRIFNVI